MNMNIQILNRNLLYFPKKKGRKKILNNFIPENNYFCNFKKLETLFQYILFSFFIIHF